MLCLWCQTEYFNGFKGVLSGAGVWNNQHSMGSVQVMSNKSKGRMYVAELLQTRLMTSMGEMDCRTDDIVGVMFVYKSKSAARKAHGKKVGLTEIKHKESL